MPNIAPILNAVVREPERVNVLTFTTHERFQSAWGGIDANFFLWNDQYAKPWVHHYAPMPANHILLPFHSSSPLVPDEIDLDLVVCQHHSQYDRAVQAATHFNVPLLRLEHTLPDEDWDEATKQALAARRGDFNVFITHDQMQAWGGEGDMIIYNAIDTNTFCPQEPWGERDSVCLSVVNDWIKRDVACGFSFWKLATKDLPTRVLGDTPGLSKAAANVQELADAYRTSLIFLNTATRSTFPTTVLEAMASGCCVVSYRAGAVAEAIEHGVDGFLVDSPEEMNAIVKRLLANPAYCEAMGRAAVKKANERFSLGRFVEEWGQALRRATKAPWWRKQWSKSA